MERIERIHVMLLLLLYVARTANGEIIAEKFTLTSINCALNKREITSSSILVSDIEYSQKTDGLNIVVYDVQKSRVLHATSFSNPNTRSFVDFIKMLPSGVLILGTSQILCNTLSATAFDTQRSVLYGMRRLGLNTQGIKPLVFRSAVFAYCKESCYPNMTSTIPLPFSQVHNFKQGSILLSFRIKSELETQVSFDHVTGHSKTINDDEDSHRHSTLYAIIISCSLFICFTICAVSVFFVRRRQNENRTLTFSNRTYDERASSNAITGNEKCELLYISKEKNNCYHQQRYEPTTSARLFSMYSDDNADTGNEETSPSMDGFASYVRVETKDRQLVYKVPSGVSKHDPPSFPPEHLIYKSSTKTEATTSTLQPSEYLDPHDYERPGYESHTSVYQEVDENHEEYMSLEPPYCEEPYNEPIYDSCSEEYHIPNCET